MTSEHRMPEERSVELVEDLWSLAEDVRHYLQEWDRQIVDPLLRRSLREQMRAALIRCDRALRASLVPLSPHQAGDSER